MKITFLLLGILFLNVLSAKAQITETEPNDSLSIANALPLNTFVSGTDCTVTTGLNEDWFRIILPTDGVLKVRSSVSTPATTSSSNFSLTLISKHKAYYNSFVPAVGANGSAVTDSFTWSCLAADTFYIRAFNSSAFPNVCYNYSFSCSVTPATFANDAELDNFPLHPIPLAYNTNTDGHLGFLSEPSIQANYDVDDYYTIVTPTDGVVRVITQTEGSSTMNVTLVDKANSVLYAQTVTAGNFQSPHTDTLYWACIAKDTMHIRPSITVAGSCGYSYRLRYDVMPPVFGNDPQPDDSYATAQVVNPNNDIDGHLIFSGTDDYDYFKFYKPDTGFLKVYMQVESYATTNNNNVNLRLQDKAHNDVKVIYPLIGGHSQPFSDSMTIASLPVDSFYLVVQNSVFGNPCISYRLRIRSSTITGTPTAGISGAIGEHFNIYPNPSTGIFNVTTDNAQKISVKVYDMYGKLVYRKAFAGEPKMEISLPDAQPGMYFIEMSEGTNRIIRKMTIL